MRIETVTEWDIRKGKGGIYIFKFMEILTGIACDIRQWIRDIVLSRAW
jgi:hypothetical protein